MSARSRLGAFRRAGGIGFTLIELLIVLVIILMILGFVAPYLVSARKSAKRTASLAQINAMSTAIQSYMIIFRAPPGWCDDGLLASATGREKLSGNENLVLSLLGRVHRADRINDSHEILTNDPLVGGNNYAINYRDITQGPISNPMNETLSNSYGAFYAPKANELKAVSGQTGAMEPMATDGIGRMPELLDIGSVGVPILYFRAQPGTGRVPVHANNPANGYFLLDHGYNYIESDVLQNATGDIYDQKNSSILSATVATNPVSNLAWLVTNQRLSTVTSGSAGSANNTDDVIQGGYFIIAPGPDGIYFDRSESGGITDLTDYSQISKFDDVMVAGGK